MNQSQGTEMQTSGNETDFLTPDEQEVLDNFYYLTRSGIQYQVWHANELKGTFLDIDKAQHVAEHQWMLRGDYTEFRLVGFYYGYNLQIKSPDGRWMTSNTFILEVKASERSCCE